MSAPKRPSDDQDPDYVSPGPTNAKQQKIYEDTARANTANKITAIIEKEFTKEIDEKEKEVLEIQNRLHKALKTLHLLRYVVVTDFYNRKQCQAPQTADIKQTQIHPAIKRLVGKTPRRQRVGLEDPSPSTSSNFECSFQPDEKDVTRVKEETSEIEKRLGQETIGLKIEEKCSLESKSKGGNDDDPPKKIPRYIPPKSNLPDISSPSRGMRHKVRKRIVVGNISKWIPPDWREDGASHKWMMYVRGSKEAPDINDFVSKVRFFLHPSYQPNDVVQVVSPPFHLSRRGWGEFPLRVQLHFKNSLNKPMDIIHYLKLDRTYTGLQTLGSETVVDIWIHTTTQKSLKNNQDLGIESKDAMEKSENDRIDMSIIKKECQDSETLVNGSNISEITVKIEPNDESVCRDENDTHIVNENCIKIEHNYVSNTSGASEITEVVNSKENNVTIKHFSPSSDKGCSKKNSLPLNDCLSSILKSNKQEKLSENLRNNVESSSSSVTEMNNINFGNKNQTVERIDENVGSQLMNRGQEEFKIRIDEFSATAKASKEKVVQSVLSDNDMNRRNEKVKNIRKNVENGEVSPLPIKLVKCNDKFFFMTDIGKLTSNQVDFVKIANSNIVKNILAKKIQPAKISVAGQTDAGLKRTTAMNSATQGRAETSELSNGQNGIEKSESIIVERNSSEYLVTESKLRLDSMDSLKMNKNFSEFERRKSETAEKLSKNNIQRLEMQRLASSLRSMPSKSEPLKITIPPAFEPTRKKQILVLKNNKLISVSAADRSSLTATLNSRQLAPRSNCSGETKAESLLINRNKVSVLTTNAKPTEGISLLKPSVSILKKPVVNNTLRSDSSSQSKPTTVLKINSSNSLLLNSNSAIPALQIALPYNNGQNERRNVVAQNRIGQVKLKRLPKGMKIDNFDDAKPAKVSVTIGKDKQKILSKKEAYEDILRSIEAVQINNVIGALRYIVRRIPLVTQEARDSDYKQMHPYACCTQEEFFNYHLGKQRAHEWYRAKMVRSLLRKKGFEDQQLWSTKEILKWARVHGYTPVQPSLAIDNAVKTSKILSDVNNRKISTCTESLQFNEWLDSCKDTNNFNEESDIEVDVVHITEPKIKSEFKAATDLPKDVITLELDSSLQLPTAFVNETAREVGVRLQKEEIIPGVMHRAAERVIVQAMQCLVDDITRRSFAKAWERNSSKCPDKIVLDDVRDALLSREEFDVFTNEGLGSLQNIG